MEIHREKDKSIAAYLLISKDVKFLGTEGAGDVLYFKFSPADIAYARAEQFLAKQADLVQPKDFADASTTVIDLIWRWRKEKDVKNGGMYDYRK